MGSVEQDLRDHEARQEARDNELEVALANAPSYLTEVISNPETLAYYLEDRVDPELLPLICELAGYVARDGENQQNIYRAFQALDRFTAALMDDEFMVDMAVSEMLDHQ